MEDKVTGFLVAQWKSPLANAGDMGSFPDPRSHMLWSN